MAFALLCFPVVLWNTVVGVREGLWLQVFGSLAFSTILGFTIFAIRRWGALELATQLFCGTADVLIFVLALSTGLPITLFGVSGVALVALFVAGRRGAIWAPVGIALSLAVAAIRALGLIPPTHLAYSSVTQAMDTATICAINSGLAWMFVSSRQRLFNELAQANETLTLEISERRRAQDRANAANQAKSDFLANMSHEIRTPMTAIMGFGDLLLDEHLSPAERTMHVEIIRRNGKHLLGLIDDILDLSKIEAGKMALEHISCSPQRVIADVISLLRVPALAKALSLQVVYATPVPDLILSDPTKLRQILMNLVSNAVKFTSKGGVVLTVRCTDPLGASPTLSFEVADSGTGIAPEHLEHVFEPFAQADATTTRKFGGTGLGLTISSRLARALGGSLSLSSELGIGSKFTLTVTTGPLDGVEMRHAVQEAGPGDSSEKSATATTPKVRGRVLLAEDGPDNQALISAYLTRAGASVTVASDGRAAVEKALAARREGDPFDLILMDMQMPELDGYGATRELRAAGYTKPIVALTANAMQGDKELCHAAGCDGYLTKPIGRDAFVATLEQHLRPPGTVPAAARLVSEWAGDLEMTELVQAFVGNLGAHVRTIDSAMAGGDVESLRRHAHQLRGAAGSYGFPTMSVAAGQLEDAIVQGSDRVQLAPLAQSLTDLCRAVRDASQST
jgi:signal transduction histidine kinase/HPt (histidine-containing phosphotransfer) domain-containing protein